MTRGGEILHGEIREKVMKVIEQNRRSVEGQHKQQEGSGKKSGVERGGNRLGEWKRRE